MRNKADSRRCYLCDETKPATLEYFPKDKNRYLGIGYQCRPCARVEYKKREKPRPLRWAQMNKEQKAARAAVQRRYNANGGWRAVRVGAYRNFDVKRGFECDLTTSWFKENIQNRPCVYCRRSDVRIGCDRIDNKLGHTMANVVPSCGDCNMARQDIFTHEEMLGLGKHIAVIFANRTHPFKMHRVRSA